MSINPYFGFLLRNYKIWLFSPCLVICTTQYGWEKGKGLISKLNGRSFIPTPPWQLETSSLGLQSMKGLFLHQICREHGSFIYITFYNFFNTFWIEYPIVPAALICKFLLQKTHDLKNRFSARYTWISRSSMIWQRFTGYHCESNILLQQEMVYYTIT